MKKGDLVMYYHSVSEKAVVGVAKVTTEAYPDPTAKEEGWSVVDLKPVKAMVESVTLDQIKTDPKLIEIALNDLFGECINRTGRFIKNEEWWVAKNCSC